MNAKQLWNFFEQATKQTSMAVFADCDTDSAPIVVGAVFAKDHISLTAELYAASDKADSASTIFEELERQFKLVKRYWQLPVVVHIVGTNTQFTVKQAVIHDTDTDPWIELS